MRAVECCATRTRLALDKVRYTCTSKRKWQIKLRPRQSAPCFPSAELRASTTKYSDSNFAAT